MQTDAQDLLPANPYSSQQTSTTSARTSSAANKSDAGNNEPSAVDEIREKGFRAYIEEIQARKKEELRAKILEAMGLDEEQLAAMPAEQRGQIEDIIAEEIRRRMLAQSAMNSSETIPGANAPDTPAGISNIQNGMNTGLALIQAMESFEEAPSSPSTDKRDDEDK